MFEWLYRRLADGIVRNIDLEAIINDEENQKLIVGLTDSLYERYKQKVLGTVGGMQKGLEYAQGNALPNILDSKGHLSLKGLLPMLLKGFVGNQGQSTPQSSNIPKELIL